MSLLRYVPSRHMYDVNEMNIIIKLLDADIVFANRLMMIVTSKHTLVSLLEVHTYLSCENPVM